MQTVLGGAETRGAELKNLDVFSRETSADEKQEHARLTRDSLPTASSRSSADSSDKEDRSTKIDASDAEESDCEVQAADASTTFGRCLLLQVRLRVLEAQLPANKEQLGIGCRAKQSSAAEAPAAEESHAAAMTTVMLRNLPNQCTRAMIIRWLNATEFKGEFDMVYAPIDRTSGNNLGYCFVNFVDAASCQRFIKVVHGMKATKSFPGSRSGKVLHVCYAKLQGREPYCPGLANLSKFAEWQEQLAVLAGMWCPAQADWGGASLRDCAAEKAADAETAEPTTSESPPGGMRRDAPEFVPGQVIQPIDALLEALTGGSLAQCAKMSHAHSKAAARAMHYSSQLYVGGGVEAAGIFTPPKEA